MLRSKPLKRTAFFPRKPESDTNTRYRFVNKSEAFDQPIALGMYFFENPLQLRYKLRLIGLVTFGKEVREGQASWVANKVSAYTDSTDCPQSLTFLKKQFRSAVRQVKV